MDRKLVGWARAVKQRGPATSLPPLWLVTDVQRLTDVAAVVARLPPRLFGVILRGDVPGHDHAARARQALYLAAVCQRRHLALSVAGDIALPMRFHVGRHLRGGQRARGRSYFLTSSAHDSAELRRGRRAGAALILLSPVFPTQSHPGDAALGARRWAVLTRGQGRFAGALGGISGNNVGRLPRWCRHVAGLGSFKC